MIKKSHRKILESDQLGPSKKEISERFVKSIKFVNEVFQYLFEAPEGHYICYRCNAKGPISYPYSKRKNEGRFSSIKIGEGFMSSYCGVCNGTGFVDFVTNARRPTTQTHLDYGFYIPTTAIDLDDKEIASTIFYNLYNGHNYKGLNLNFKKPNFDRIKNKKIKKFIEYFAEYKKARDKRKKFINKNFTDLQNNLLKSTKYSNFERNQYECSHCKSQPFDILHNENYDTIDLTMCGKCYGRGYQNKNDTLPIFDKYIFELEYPDYSSKKKMLMSILFSADRYYSSFMVRLDQIKNSEKQLKKKNTTATVTA